MSSDQVAAYNQSIGYPGTSTYKTPNRGGEDVLRAYLNAAKQHDQLGALRALTGQRQAAVDRATNSGGVGTLAQTYVDAPMGRITANQWTTHQERTNKAKIDPNLKKFSKYGWAPQDFSNLTPVKRTSLM